MIEGLKQKLQAEVERLNHEISFVLPKEIEKARVHHLRMRLAKLSDVREQDIPRDRVGFGSRVTVEDLDTKKKEVYALTLGEFIEGEDGADEMPVSMASPLGKALVGGKVGQKVDITLPMGKRKLKILSLHTVHDLAERSCLKRFDVIT